MSKSLKSLEKLEPADPKVAIELPAPKAEGMAVSEEMIAEELHEAPSRVRARRPLVLPEIRRLAAVAANLPPGHEWAPLGDWCLPFGYRFGGLPEERALWIEAAVGQAAERGWVVPARRCWAGTLPSGDIVFAAQDFANTTKNPVTIEGGGVLEWGLWRLPEGARQVALYRLRDSDPVARVEPFPAEAALAAFPWLSEAFGRREDGRYAVLPGWLLVSCRLDMLPVPATTIIRAYSNHFALFRVMRGDRRPEAVEGLPPGQLHIIDRIEALPGSGGCGVARDVAPATISEDVRPGFYRLYKAPGSLT